MYITIRICTPICILYQIRALRVLPSLSSVTLAGNPVCGAAYPALVLAYLPRVAYLDHRLVDPAKQRAAAEEYKEEVNVYVVSF